MVVYINSASFISIQGPYDPPNLFKVPSCDEKCHFLEISMFLEKCSQKRSLNFGIRKFKKMYYIKHKMWYDRKIFLSSSPLHPPPPPITNISVAKISFSFSKVSLEAGSPFNLLMLPTPLSSEADVCLLLVVFAVGYCRLINYPYF